MLLKEDRTVQRLREEWWIKRNTRIGLDGQTVNCTKEKEINVDTPELDMGNVGGIFIVLAGGIAVAILIGVLEFLWNVRKVSISQKVLVSHHSAPAMFSFIRNGAFPIFFPAP